MNDITDTLKKRFLNGSKMYQWVILLPQIMETSRFYGGRSRHHDVLEEDIMPVPDDPEDVVVINFGNKCRQLLQYPFFFCIEKKCEIFIFCLIEKISWKHQWFYASFQTNLSY